MKSFVHWKKHILSTYVAIIVLWTRTRARFSLGSSLVSRAHLVNLDRCLGVSAGVGRNASTCKCVKTKDAAEHLTVQRMLSITKNSSAPRNKSTEVDKS